MNKMQALLKLNYNVKTSDETLIASNKICSPIIMHKIILLRATFYKYTRRLNSILTNNQDPIKPPVTYV